MSPPAAPTDYAEEVRGLTHSDDELEKANQSINILNRVVTQVSRSTLALQQQTV
ncbi:MAG: hypothetical protein O7H39_06390 [Gammaproteobacteria bacterium]|nr:hypothetical protein [Gammaproteobacteria bacterium]